MINGLALKPIWQLGWQQPAKLAQAPSVAPLARVSLPAVLIPVTGSAF
jgi:hypothetical protein